VKGLSALADERCRTDKLDGVIKHTSSRETTMVGRGASLEGRLFLGPIDAMGRARSRSSPGYRPAILPLDSLVGSLAARPIASIGPPKAAIAALAA